MQAEARIHPTAVVAPGVKLGVGVEIGPYAIIGEHVIIGDRAKIHPHAVIDGHTTLGDEVEVFPFAAIGLAPQDKKYDGSATKLLVGNNTVLRECTTLQPGTAGGGGVTQIGERCLIMAYCHIAHDCVVGDDIVMANATQIAGHCVIEDHAILGGMTAVHQFVRIGERAFTGAATRVMQDIPPFMTADGHPAGLVGLNRVGLERGGVSGSAIKALKLAYKKIFVRGPFRKAIAEVEAGLGREVEEVAQLCRFLAKSERGITRARSRGKRNSS